MDIKDKNVTIQELRESGHCVRGLRDWFVGYGFDFKDVVRNGVPADDVYKLNDELGNQVMDKAMARRKQNIERGQ